MQALPRRLQFKTVGFPHSDISGSKATNRLPEAFRRLVASFIAVLGQGIHRALLCLSYGDLHSTPSGHSQRVLFSTCSPTCGEAREGSIFPASSAARTPGRLCIFVCQKAVSLETKTAPRGGFRALSRRRPYGLSAPKKVSFRFVDT